jgi:23S rRNA (adenine2503-C2)-methyltransferase
MLSQVYEIGKDLKERISNIVIMGSGEPLHNFDNTIKFLELINSKDGLEVGHRHITLSTCGIVEKIKELEKMRLQITLAVSLHAPNDEIRESIMPIAKRYSIDELILAAKEYADFTKRRVTFEYALIKGVNDSVECAKELAERLKGSLCHVNLIPVNDVKERNYIRSSDETVNDFYKVLKRLNIDVTVRRKLGSDINASCGQLRKKYIGNY